MGFIVVMLVLGLIGGVVAAFVFAGAGSKAQNKAEAEAPQRLDEMFNGDEVVTYNSGFASLKYETVVKGALERGYELYSDGGRNSYGSQELIFRKTAQQR